MNKRIKDELKTAYSIVADESKDRFLESIRRNDMSCLKFMFLQCKYLHTNAIIKSSVLVILMVLMCLISNSDDVLLFISIGIPFIVLIMIYELESSKIYRVEELEKATRFSLKMLVFSRLLITGFISLICIIFISLIAYSVKQLSLINITIYFFLPYLASIYLCMKVVRKFNDVGIKYCFIVAAVISLIVSIVYKVPKLCRVLSYPFISYSLLVICILLVIVESKEFLNRKEECIWN